TIALPPLRDRKEDIPILASYFIKLFSERNGRTVRLASNALDAMKHYSWPGNVRELKNMLERAMTFNDTGVVQLEELEFGEAEDGALIEPSSAPSLDAAPYRASASRARSFPGGEASLDAMEREHIIKILKQTGGNK